ncbi:MAG TPA: putative glycolipid-binding domain-containing protein [Ktedonobacterales bacterium]|jgi:hypothetical protein
MGSYTHHVWISEDELGIEDVRIAHDPTSGTGFSGTVVRLWEGQPLRVTYNLDCDTGWRVRELQVSGESEAVGGSAIRLYADGAGNWTDDKGQSLGALQGCIDVDIMLTPLTNTLPIRRLQLAPGESREISVVYIAAPDLSISPFRQRYTRLDDADGGQRYRYESVDSGFTADLPVDDDGFVVDYPGIWRRVWPTT